MGVIIFPAKTPVMHRGLAKAFPTKPNPAQEIVRKTGERREERGERGMMTSTARA